MTVLKSANLAIKESEFIQFWHEIIGQYNLYQLLIKLFNQPRSKNNYLKKFRNLVHSFLKFNHHLGRAICNYF